MSAPRVLAELAKKGGDRAIDEAFGRNRPSHNATTGVEDDRLVHSVSSLILGVTPLITFRLGSVGSVLLEYVLFQLISTLAMVETPVPGGVVSEKYSLLDGVQAASKRSDEHVIGSTGDYYVSSGIRSTLRHIQSEAGDLSMFRGFGARIAVDGISEATLVIIQAILYYPAKFLNARRFVSTFSKAITKILQAQFESTWVQIVISKPRNKFWFRRLPLTFFTMIRILWIPILAAFTARELFNRAESAAMEYLKPYSVSTVSTTRLYYSDGPMVNPNFLSISWTVSKTFLTALVVPNLDLLVLAPFNIVTDRIVASVLPDEDDPIVPIDRSFSSGSDTGHLHQQQPLGVVSAFRSVDWKTYLRIVKITLKCRIIIGTLSWCFWTLIVAQVATLVGPRAIWVVLKINFGVPIVHGDMEGVSQIARDIFKTVIFDAPMSSGTRTESALTAAHVNV